MTRARRAPMPAHVRPLRLFQSRDEVVVTDGLARDTEGVVVDLDELRFGTEATYRVDFGGLLGVRLIRESYLRRRS